jgi:hypothetical protein
VSKPALWIIIIALAISKNPPAITIIALAIAAIAATPHTGVSALGATPDPIVVNAIPDRWRNFKDVC